MNTGFFANFQLLELLAFFSGYPLLYAVIFFIAGKPEKKNTTKSSLISLLPFTYALLGSLYVGLLLKNFYPDYSFNHLTQSIHQPFLVSWGIVSLVFWFPKMGKKTWLSLLHSLVFFILFSRDVLIQSPSIMNDDGVVKNEMKIYTVSLLINLVAYTFMCAIYFLGKTYSRRK